jgi:hypothetical protein
MELQNVQWTIETWHEKIEPPNSWEAKSSL